MTVVASAIALLPGKLEAWRKFAQEMAGPRKKEHDESRRRLGVTMERAWIQPTPQGNLIIVYRESEGDAESFYTRLAASKEPFNVWFKQQVKELHGLDDDQPPQAPPPELAFDYHR
jgi:hypothetical protein